MNRNVANRLLPWLVIALAGALYLATLDRGLRPDELTGGDLITHQYAQAQARPGNAPGYPLYTMLGWLWFRAGRALLGRALNPVQVLSLYSTLWGLASLWVLYHLLARREVTGGNHLLAALLTLFYAVTYFFWYYSVTTEQYTSAIFQTLLLVWLAFEWEARPGDRTLLAMAFVGGTMLANMLTTLFILPPLLYLIFTRRPDLLRRGRQVASAVGAGFLPLLSYAYVYIRGAQHPEWRGAGTWASTADWFIQFLGTRQGRDELLPGLTLHNLVTPEYPALMWGELTWLALAGGLIGWALLGRRKAGFFYGTLAIYLAFTTAYRFGNWFQVILPLYPLLVLGFGRSVARLWERTSARRAARALIALSLLLLIGYRAVASERELRLHGHNTPADTGLAPGRAVLADVESPGWEISSAFEEWVALQYLMTIWRAEPAVRPVEPGAPAEYVTRRAAAAFQNLVGPVSVHPAAVGANLIRLRPDPLTVLPPDARPVRLDFGGQMELRGARLERGGALATLYWTAPAPIAGDYTVSVRLWQNGQPIEGDGGPLIQDHRPVWNTYPTSRWRPGELIADAYTFSLPPAAHPDRIQVVVYRQTPDGFENLGEGMVDK